MFRKQLSDGDFADVGCKFAGELESLQTAQQVVFVLVQIEQVALVVSQIVLLLAVEAVRHWLKLAVVRSELVLVAEHRSGFVAGLDSAVLVVRSELVLVAGHRSGFVAALESAVSVVLDSVAAVLNSVVVVFVEVVAVAGLVVVEVLPAPGSAFAVADAGVAVDHELVGKFVVAVNEGCSKFVAVSAVVRDVALVAFVEQPTDVDLLPLVLVPVVAGAG